MPRRVRQLLPLSVAVLFILTMTALGVNGSSAGLLRDDSTESVVAFQPRPIRGDEWQDRTPMVVRQATTDLPHTSVLAVGSHDMGVMSDLPAAPLDLLIRPATAVYHVLDVERAFAFEWWLVIVGPFIGTYTLLLVLTRKVMHSVLSGLLVLFAPVLSWWAIPAMGLPVLYGGVGTALLLLAVEERRGRTLLAIAAGWLFAAATSSMYLPWLLPLAMVFGAVLIAALPWGQLRERVRWPMVISAATAIAIVVSFVVRHRFAVEAMTDTVYPGQRRTSSGGLGLARFLSAPFDTMATGRKLGEFYGTNQSEASSGMMLWIPVVLAGGLFAPLRRWRSADRNARVMASLAVLCTALAAWATLPMPGLVGRITLLDHSHGPRLVWPITVAGAVLIGLYLAGVQEGTVAAPDRSRARAALFVFCGLTAWSGGQAVIDNERPDPATLFLIIAAVIVATWLVLHGRSAGVLVAVALMATSSVRVNPVQVGLGPVLDAPLVQQVRTLATTADGLWMVAGADQRAAALVLASGVPTTEGLSWYPDPSAWHVLDPAGAYTRVWNRLANLSFLIEPGAEVPTMGLPDPDSVQITIDPCDPSLTELGVRWIVSAHEISAECLIERAIPDDPEERYIYERHHD